MYINSLHHAYKSRSVTPHLLTAPLPAIQSTTSRFITGFSLRLNARSISCASSPPRIAAEGANSVGDVVARWLWDGGTRSKG